MSRILLIIYFFVLNIGLIHAQIAIIYGDKVFEVEMNAINDFKVDLERSRFEDVILLPYSNNIDKSSYNHIFYIGTKQSHPFIRSYIKKNNISKLESETFLLEGKSSLKETYIIGADVRGVFYGVYKYSEMILGIDPFEYWTDIKPCKTKSDFPDVNYREEAPVFKLRGYFDNDNDLLANWKERKLIVEFDIWKEMINSLARLRYNFIDIHDLLGRPEYYLREYYINLTEYHTDLALVDKVIDYAHSKGMLVQIPMYLGWEFHHMDFDKVSLSKYYNHWMDVYEYYLTKSPLGKGDLFLQRPRHPYYDWPYKCIEEDEAGIKTGPLMSKMFLGLYKLIKKHKPGAILFCDLWSEGRAMWESGEFSPNQNVKMLWADNGYAIYNEFPSDNKGYDFGIYIHAGLWKNNVTQNPYPDRIWRSSMQALEKGMTYSYMVNGQTFKDFILNIEACARCAWNPVKFSPDNFYKEWSLRYFGEQVSDKVIEIYKKINETNNPIGGFRDIMSFTVNTINDLEKGNLEYKSLDVVEQTLAIADDVYNMAVDIESEIPMESLNTFYEQILLPTHIFKINVELYLATLKYNNIIYEIYKKNNVVNKSSLSRTEFNLKNKLSELRAILKDGSGWDKWTGFYLPENFRMHTPPPAMDKVMSLFDKY